MVSSDFSITGLLSLSLINPDEKVGFQRGTSFFCHQEMGNSGFVELEEAPHCMESRRS